LDDSQGNYRITDFEESQRPRERLETLGAEALSNAELLAILLRVGMKGANAVQIGQKTLDHFNGLLGVHRTGFTELCQVDGIGKAKAAQIKAAIELGRRINSLSIDSRRQISSPQDVADLVMYEMMALEQEELWVILLDTRNRLLGKDRLYRGSLNASSVRPVEVFKRAIRHNAASLIIVHNHPSGDPSPSPEDVNLTRVLLDAGRLLECPLLDHIVVGANGVASIKSLRPDLWSGG
jgi:DNA repair protein RadC